MKFHPVISLSISYCLCKINRNLLIVFTFLFFIVVNVSFGQNYKPLNRIPENGALIMELERLLEEDNKALPDLNRKKVSKVYEERTESIIRSIEGEEYLFNNSINDFANSILSHILETNPSIKNERIRLLVRGSIPPNAACFGEGTLELNIGLFRKLKSEDQLAFVICHELAHYVADHVNNKIATKIKTIREIKKSKEFRKLKRKRYQRYSSMKEFMKDYVYENNKHSREHEVFADSLGLVFYLNTKYAPQEALNCIAQLDSIDELKYVEPVDFEEIFNSSFYPFQKKWIADHRSGLSKLKFSKEVIENDSLKTHPDAGIRYELLKKYLEDVKLEGAPANNMKNNFQEFVRQADYEIIESCFKLGDLGRSLFYAMQLLQLNPEDAYLRATIGKTLFKIYKTKEESELYLYAEKPGNQTIDDYKKVLRLIHRISLNELQELNYYFLQTENPKYLNHEEYLFALWLSVKNRNSLDVAAIYKKRYFEIFPNGKYSTLFNE